METKICTSIEQSKKLLELGLNADTADMGYNGVENRDTGRIWYDKYPTTMPNVDSIPAWSLSALLELMPKHIFSEDRIKNYTPVLHIGEKNVVWYQHMNEFLHIEHADTPIEAAYFMVIWLLENNYIKTEKK